MRRAVPLTLLLALAGCGGQEHEPPDQTVAVFPAPLEGEPHGPPSSRVFIRAVTLDGAPLPGVVPIATRRANAFDEPLARGDATGPDGRGHVAGPARERLFVRAWDPEYRTFAANFVEVPPSEGGTTPRTDVVMVPGAMLSMRLTVPTGELPVRRRADLMLVHPVEGNWWPADTVTDESGRAVFGLVPAGLFDVLVRIEGIGEGSVRGVTLPPGERVELGDIVLQAGDEGAPETVSPLDYPEGPNPRHAPGDA